MNSIFFKSHRYLLNHSLLSTNTRVFSTEALPYKSFMNQFFKEQEVKSKEMELQGLLSILSLKKMDYKERYERSKRMSEGKLSE